LNFPNDEVFLTTEEVLEYLQVNLRTVYRLIKAGKIPAVRVGRQWRFRKRDIDAWLESQRPRQSRAGVAAPRAPVAAAGSRPRVLVVDDESAIRDLLSKTLALAEYDVDLATDGRHALERLRIIPYDLLITDLKMPGVDGLTVIKEARRLKTDIPVIIITGFSTENSAIEAVNLGVTGYLTKPFRVPQVLAAAAKALGASAA
jgi:excisionase family DNA binding protein